jgi:hypothetical protein
MSLGTDVSEYESENYVPDTPITTSRNDILLKELERRYIGAQFDGELS